MPSANTRRVSMFVALPVILACAVTGSVLGVTYPIRSLVDRPGPAEERASPTIVREVSSPDANSPAATPTTTTAPSVDRPNTGEMQVPEAPVSTKAAVTIAAPVVEQVSPTSETAPVEVRSAPVREAAPLGATEVAPVSTGSVERSLSPGPAEPITAKDSAARDNVAATGPDRSEAAASEAERRHAVVNPRVERAKRLRRALARRPGPTANTPGSPVESFFTSFFTKN